MLTSHFQFSGQLETVGPVGVFINDPTRESFSLYDVHFLPLTPGSPLRGIARPHVVVLRSQIMLLSLDSEEGRQSITTFARRELLTIYTPIAVCRGHFPLPAEARIADFLGVIPGELLALLDAHIFPFIDLPNPFPSQAEMLLIGRQSMLFYHPG